MCIGNIKKLESSLNETVKYYLPLGNEEKVFLNKYLGKEIFIEYLNAINCVACNREIKKTFFSGYCYPCFSSLAQCDQCIVKPELCHFHNGTCRDEKWALSNCMIPHIVYLSNTSNLKIGITRGTQVPTRWIDQGAGFALPILEVSSRRLSGLIEIEIAKNIADKTNWRKMLGGPSEYIDLVQNKKTILKNFSKEINLLKTKFGADSVLDLPNQDVVEINYPIISYPQKVKSLSLDKNKVINGILNGIKGQYLILDSGVFNVRKHSGYKIRFNA